MFLDLARMMYTTSLCCVCVNMKCGEGVSCVSIVCGETLSLYLSPRDRREIESEFSTIENAKHRSDHSTVQGVPQDTNGELGAAFWHLVPQMSGLSTWTVHVDSPRGPRLATTTYDGQTCGKRSVEAP